MRLPDSEHLPYNACMNPCSTLYQLQKFDSELKLVEQRLTAIQKAISTDRRVQTAQQDLQTAAQELFKMELALRTAEENVKEVRIKIQTSEAKLYSGRISNPKELQDIQMEVAANKKRLSALEDDQLTAMFALEKAEETHQLRETNLTQTKADTMSDQASLRGEHSQLMKTRERLLSERQVITGSLEQAHLEIYDHLIKTKYGLAVTPIEDDTCVACGSTLRSDILQAARSPKEKEITFCPSCKRILYAG